MLNSKFFLLLLIPLLFSNCRKDENVFDTSEKYHQSLIFKERYYGHENLLLEYASTNNSGIKIYDFTNLENPTIHQHDIEDVYLGQIKDDRLYILLQPNGSVAGHLQIYDVSNLATATLLATFDVGVHFFTKIDFFEGTLYLGGSTGLYYLPIDESDFMGTDVIEKEVKPLFRYDAVIDPGIHQIEFSENKLIFVRTVGVWIADISNPVTPDSLAMMPVQEHTNILGANFKNNTLFVLEDRDLFAYDFPSLEKLDEMQDNDGGKSPIVFLNNNTLLMSSGLEMKFIDISKPSKLKIRDRFGHQWVSKYIQIINEEKVLLLQDKALTAYFIE